MEGCFLTPTAKGAQAPNPNSASKVGEISPVCFLCWKHSNMQQIWRNTLDISTCMLRCTAGESLPPFGQVSQCDSDIQFYEKYCSVLNVI